MSDSAGRQFGGTSRYTVRRRLGAGWAGDVYEVEDLERGSMVALETIGAEGEERTRVLASLRGRATIRHPNLVEIYDIEDRGACAFFTRELVDGVSFIEAARAGVSEERAGTLEAGWETPSGTEEAAEVLDESWGRARPKRFRDGSSGSGGEPLGRLALDFQRIRSLFSQLASGLEALHGAGQLHLGLDPTIVQVTIPGRVVILDRSFGGTGAAAASGESTGGASPYSAPEIAGNAHPTAAADWFSVGVVLYETLTGHLPEEKPAPDESFPPLVRPAELFPATPVDLDRLTVDLLDHRPENRPAGGVVIDRLAEAGGGERPPADAPMPRSVPFFGRHRELWELWDAFKETKNGNAVAVFVRGSSGIGKSALVRRFFHELRRKSDALILRGRCFEGETVPYKALDGVIGALVEHLASLPRAQVDALLPRDVLALAKLFPALRQVDAVAGARRRVLEIPDTQELRRRAFSAFRDLVGRIADRRAVVIAIDDLQFGDGDSSAILTNLLAPPNPPPVILIGCIRREALDANSLARRLSQASERSGDPLVIRWVDLEPLTPDEARRMTLSMIAGSREISESTVESVVRDSGGSPFFIAELVRHARASGSALPGDEERSVDDGIGDETLQGVIQHRLARLPAVARRLLEVIAVAGHPLPSSVARRAACLEGPGWATLALLVAGHWVRAKGARDSDSIEINHDRILRSVLARLGKEDLAKIHLSLALALESSGGADPESLAVHFRAGGESSRAAEYAAEAAERAFEALAFDRAARLFRMLVELDSGNSSSRRPHRIRLCESLANAGRGAEAAREYLEAARESLVTDTLELQRRAAEQLLRAGHIDEGLETIRRVLGRIGMKLSEHRVRVLLTLLARRLQIRLRGLGFESRPVGEVPPGELIRVDTCWSVAMGLALVDTIRGAESQSRHLLLALRAGEPYRVARALACEIGYSATAGGKGRARTDALIVSTTALVEKSGDPHARGLLAMVLGLAEFLSGRWGAAQKRGEEADEILRTECTGVSWERDTTNLYFLESTLFLGEWNTLFERLPLILKEAVDRGDRYAETSLRARFSWIPALAADRPGRAVAALENVVDRWSHAGFHLQHYWDARARIDIALYEGHGHDAWSRMESIWGPLRRSLLLQIQQTRILTLETRGRAALAAAVDSRKNSEISRFLRHAEADASRIERERMEWAVPFARLLRAGAAVTRGAEREARELARQAALEFESCGMSLYAAVAKRRAAQLTAGEEGVAGVREADRFITSERIENPERLSAMFAPGWWKR